MVQASTSGTTQTYSAGMRDLIAEFVTGQGISEGEIAAWLDDLGALGDSLSRDEFGDEVAHPGTAM